MDSRRSKIILAFVVTVFVFGFVIAITRSDRSRDLVLRLEPIDPDDDVTVYVGGAVEAPGLYSLPRGSRVADALDLAGLSDDGTASGLELARILADEQSIIVPELQPRSESQVASSVQVERPANSTLININLATEAELQALPGIGPALSQRIVEHRNQHGSFQSLDELSQISGISERMVDELRTLATTGH